MRPRRAGPDALLVVRILAGLAEGGMVAVATELVARSRRAERIGGMFVTLQTMAQCFTALALALWVIPSAGSKGGFFALSVIALASLAVVASVPSRYEELPNPSESLDGVLRLRSLNALAVIFFFFMFIGAIWAFLEPLGAQYGIDGQAIGVMVSASLAIQVVGAAMATWLEARLDYRVAISGVGIVAIIAAAILAGGPTPAMFRAAVLAIGFIWLFVIPYQIRLAITADSTRGTALLVPAAQLLGSALGPVAASLFIIGADVRPVPEFAAASVARQPRSCSACSSPRPAAAPPPREGRRRCRTSAMEQLVRPCNRRAATDRRTGRSR